MVSINELKSMHNLSILKDSKNLKHKVENNQLNNLRSYFIKNTLNFFEDKGASDRLRLEEDRRKVHAYLGKI